jgi:hypothetical protein
MHMISIMIKSSSWKFYRAGFKVSKFVTEIEFYNFRELISQQSIYIVIHSTIRFFFVQRRSSNIFK